MHTLRIFGIATVARLSSSRYSRLETKCLGLCQATRVCRLDNDVVSSIHERWNTALGNSSSIVTTDVTALSGNLPWTQNEREQQQSGNTTFHYCPSASHDSHRLTLTNLHWSSLPNQPISLTHSLQQQQLHTTPLTITTKSTTCRPKWHRSALYQTRTTPAVKNFLGPPLSFVTPVRIGEKFAASLGGALHWAGNFSIARWRTMYFHILIIQKLNNY